MASGDSPSSSAVNTFGLVGSDNDIGQGSAVQEDEDGVVFTRLGLFLAHSSCVEGVSKFQPQRDRFRGDLLLRSYLFMPPSNELVTVMGAELVTTPDEAGRVVVRPVLVVALPLVVVVLSVVVLVAPLLPV